MKIYNFAAIVTFFFAFLITGADGLRAQTAQIRLGAYYFDGWTGYTSHINKRMSNGFLDRKPIGGWITSTPKGIIDQIDQASQAGISFFNFCWYYKGNSSEDSLFSDPKNNALNLYRKAPNKKKLGFALMIANHEGYVINRLHWPKLIGFWCKIFQDKSYEKTNGAPVITFFSVRSLLVTFKSKEGLKIALKELRLEAKRNGFNKLCIVASVPDNHENFILAQDCGFDAITVYNLHGSGFSKNINEVLNPIDSLIFNETKVFDRMSNVSLLPVIPVITLNWDRRPWDSDNVKVSRRYTGFSQTSVVKSILSVRKWVGKNPEKVLPERLVFVYAWNEYGEGAWLTPSVDLGNSLLQGVKQGLR